jgi:leucyl aminopeptidase
LVLADVLWYCQQKFDPRFMVDLATLTGAMIVALGHEYAGMFSNDDALAQKLSSAGQAIDEKVWRFPLDDAYDRLIRSEIADMKNIGGRPETDQCRALHQRFVNKKPGPSRHGSGGARKDAPCVLKGATALVRLLDRLVRNH